MKHPARWAWERATGYSRPGWIRSGLYFRRLGGRRDFQLNVKRYWSPVRLKTWPPNLKTGTVKRSIGFGVGYLSWRVNP